MQKRNMKYAKDLLEVIGNTPLVKLNTIVGGIDALVLAKLEYLNPGGSMKDRIGITMIEDGEKKGLLKKGGLIVEPTSGNTGVGLAIVAAIRGYKVIFTNDAARLRCRSSAGSCRCRAG
ncbi:MAG: Cystathionine beta-synthase [Candidatus Daviesbacteria bacterium GW2011_GWF2_38_6]|uniref:Cystathionine beta-synthase n=1 Tax=Candidatus Daviesbacteria bacterium GW2011_GWF2_38_6 TaxID=1618432 RepID=A0A0G0NIK9_9BACT|nr:MAG: Cystathionine beta-synthase [Candidatus Daviesbacteria bacterium GW2011_GWF2_38_6]